MVSHAHCSTPRFAYCLPTAKLFKVATSKSVHPRNARSSMWRPMQFVRRTTLRLEQSQKAYESIKTSESGKFSSVNPAHPRNACWPMWVSESGRCSVVSWAHHSKAPTPICVREWGSVTVVSLAQLKNAPSSMRRMNCGSATCVDNIIWCVQWVRECVQYSECTTV
jgi:hypothetical protein